MNAKYIIYKDEHALLRFVIFDAIQNHVDIARLLKINRSGTSDNSLVSAGLISMNEDNIQCYGKSVTLKIESRGTLDDAVISLLGDL